MSISIPGFVKLFDGCLVHRRATQVCMSYITLYNPLLCTHHILHVCTTGQSETGFFQVPSDRLAAAPGLMTNTDVRTVTKWKIHSNQSQGLFQIGSIQNPACSLPKYGAALAIAHSKPVDTQGVNQVPSTCWASHWPPHLCWLLFLPTLTVGKFRS